MEKQALIEALERLVDEASKKGLPDQEIIDALQNVTSAVKRYPVQRKAS